MSHFAELIRLRLEDEQKERKSKNGFWVTDLSSCLTGVIISRCISNDMEVPERGKFKAMPELDDRLLRVFKCGNLFEQFLLDSIPKENLIETQTRITWPEYDLSGRLDAIIKDTQDGELVLKEIKSQHSQAFHWMKKRGGANPAHVQQIMLYYSKKRLENPNLRADITYVSKDDLCINEYSITYDQKLVNEALEKAKLLKECWDNKTLPIPPETIVFDPLKGKFTLNYLATYCPVHHICLNDEKWEEKAQQEIDRLNEKK